MSWASALAATDAAVAAVFDETTCEAFGLMRPARSVNSGPITDPDRLPFSFLATVELDAGLIGLRGGSGEEALARSGGDRQVSRCCLSALATGWPWVPREGDRITIAGQQHFVAASPDRDGTDRVVIWLNRGP